MKKLYYLFNFLLIGLLVLPFGLVLASKRKKRKLPAATVNEHEFACIITAYRNAAMAVPLVESLLQQSHRRFSIYLVADDCGALPNFPKSDRLHLLQPSEPLRSKVRSMRYAVEHFVSTPDYVVVFDPDNLAETSFLSTLNRYTQQGYAAVQGRRMAKNLNTTYACADAMGEYYKNYIEREVPFRLGSSATIAGSGMAVEADAFCRFLHSPTVEQFLNAGKVIAAEDKWLHHQLVADGMIIAFATDAIVYDEKVTQGDQVKRQRTRWIYAYTENAGRAVEHLRKGVQENSTNKLLFGFLSAYPPLFLLVLAAGGLLMFNLLFAPMLAVGLLVGLKVFAANFLWTLYLSRAPQAVWKALWVLPAFVAQQCLALLQLNRAANDFLPTQHSESVRLEDMGTDIFIHPQTKPVER